MSAGGKTLLGVTSMNIRNASDVTAQRKLSLMYQNFSADNGTAYANRTPNGNDYYSQFLAGAKECGGSACQSGGLPYTRTLTMTFKNS